jgi:hypothetical protein
MLGRLRDLLLRCMDVIMGSLCLNRLVQLDMLSQLVPLLAS